MQIPQRSFLAAPSPPTSAVDRTDAEFLGRWALLRGGHEMFSMPRIAALRSFVLSHLIHHRGQLSVYLRFLDVPVPAIYGRSADENPFVEAL